MEPPARAVVVGASAGGVEALLQLFSALPADFPGAIFVVLHIAPTAHSVLPQILTRVCPLDVRGAVDGERLFAGQARVAPPDQHLLLTREVSRITRGPRENGHRPAVDPLFRTAAEAFGPRTVAVLLSGTRDDGTAGAVFVRRLGGRVLVQDPEEALYDGMPRAAIAAAAVDEVLPVGQLAERLVQLSTRTGEELVTPGPPFDDFPGDDPHVRPTSLTCPECGGTLWEQDGQVPRFVCHIGHAYSLESMVEEHANSVEVAIWSAVRALDERAHLLRRIAGRLGTSSTSALRYERRADEAAGHARVIREHVLDAGQSPAPADEPDMEPAGS